MGWVNAILNNFQENVLNNENYTENGIKRIILYIIGCKYYKDVKTKLYICILHRTNNHANVLYITKK